MSSPEEPRAVRNRRLRRKASTEEWLSYVGDCRQLTEYLAKKPFKSRWFPLKFLDALFRGYGQVVFANNPLSGVLVAVALTIANPEASLAGLTTAIVGLLVSLALKQNPTTISAGLTVFNPLLVGLVTVSTLPTKYGLQMDPLIWLFMLVAAVLSVYVTSAVSSIMHTLGPYPAPSFTVPFNIVQVLLFTCVINKFPYSHIIGGTAANETRLGQEPLSDIASTVQLHEPPHLVDKSKQAPEKFTEFIDGLALKIVYENADDGSKISLVTTSYGGKTLTHSSTETPLASSRKSFVENFTDSSRETKFDGIINRNAELRVVAQNPTYFLDRNSSDDDNSTKGNSSSETRHFSATSSMQNENYMSSERNEISNFTSAETKRIAQDTTHTNTRGNHTNDINGEKEGRLHENSGIQSLQIVRYSDTSTKDSITDGINSSSRGHSISDFTSTNTFENTYTGSNNTNRTSTAYEILQNITQSSMEENSTGEVNDEVTNPVYESAANYSSEMVLYSKNNTSANITDENNSRSKGSGLFNFISSNSEKLHIENSNSNLTSPSKHEIAQNITHLPMKETFMGGESEDLDHIYGSTGNQSLEGIYHPEDSSGDYKNTGYFNNTGDDSYNVTGNQTSQASRRQNYIPNITSTSINMTDSFIDENFEGSAKSETSEQFHDSNGNQPSKILYHPERISEDSTQSPSYLITNFPAVDNTSREDFTEDYTEPWDIQEDVSAGDTTTKTESQRGEVDVESKRASARERRAAQLSNMTSERENGTTPSPPPGEVDWGQVFAGMVLSASQVYGYCDASTSATIYLAILVFSPTMAAFSASGALLGTLIGLVFSNPPYADVYAGEWGMQGLLCAAALGGFCYVLTIQSAVAAYMCVLLGTVLKYALSRSYDLANLPVLSMPFNIASILFLYITSVSDEDFVQPEVLTFPEKHWYDYRKQRSSRDDKEKGAHQISAKEEESNREEEQKLATTEDDVA